VLGLTRKTEYGLAALAYLARVPGRLACARAISERLSVPVSLLMNVLKELAGAGYIESVRGAHGGYRLARPADEIGLGELFRDLEGPIRRSGCLRGRPEGQDRRRCTRMSVCRVADPVHRVHRKLREFLQALTLADVIGPDGPAGGPGRKPPQARKQDAVNVPETADLP